MRLITLADTETTGVIPKHAEAYELHRMPQIVQLAAMFVDADTFEILAAMNVIVKPDGKYEVPEGAAAIHGITTEIAERDGIPLEDALRQFHDGYWKSGGLVCHNYGFDSKIIAAGYFRCGAKKDFIRAKPGFCTMLAATPICKLPKDVVYRASDPYKWPKLQQCHQMFFGEEFEDAHDAMADLRATLRVYRHLREIGAIAPPA